MERLYAIGDIHGCLDKLRDLVLRCERDAGGAPASFVFIGDYIDRGPDSRGVIEYLMDLQSRCARRPGGDAIFLKGNHEALALAACDGEVITWLMNGGDATLDSYGVDSAQELPAEHVAWLGALPLIYDDGRRLFVHAGVDPSRGLDQQDEHDLVWIREPFLSDRRDHGRLIVHGHTPMRTGRPDLRSNRLNIDTGAVFGGPLTAAVFGGDQREPIGFIQAGD